MGDLRSRGSCENHHGLKVFLGLRMMVLALVVGAGIMIVQLSLDEVSVAPLYVLLVLSYVVGGVLYAAVRLGINAVVGLWFLMVADIALETGLLHFSGGVTSQFSLIFCLSIIAAAFLLQVPGGLGIALLASLTYVGYGLLESNGILAPRGSGEDIARQSSGFLQTYMHVSLFFLVGAVGGYLAERIQLKGRQLQTAERELKRLKIDNANILRNMSSGVLVVDSEGKIITINPSAEHILQVDREDVVSMHVEAVFETLMPELADELVQALNLEESKRRHELLVERQGHDPLPLGISISLLKDDDGDKRGIIAVFQDLTEVRDMEERIRKADRLAAIGELSAGIAHEIRNPLASISGSIEMLNNELQVDGENKRLMELIIKESDRLDRIINDFLEFARLRPPSMNEISVADCIEDVAVLLRNSSATTCTIATQVQTEVRRVLVRMDEEQMKQVFLNLSINACDAMPGGGELRIVAQILEDSSLQVSFLDEGCGITEDAFSHLYEPFFTTKDGGTGLGLALANKIVEAHGGTIEARNREEGGSEFCIVLPRSAFSQATSETFGTSLITH